eukprot:14036351-Alexandrium_andersonii.AAC.1
MVAAGEGCEGSRDGEQEQQVDASICELIRGEVASTGNAVRSSQHNAAQLGRHTPRPPVGPPGGRAR